MVQGLRKTIKRKSSAGSDLYHCLEGCAAELILGLVRAYTVFDRGRPVRNQRQLLCNKPNSLPHDMAQALLMVKMPNRGGSDG
jgi:hypothetical protein